MVELSGQTIALMLLVVGVVLSIAEAVAPGAHLVVLGVALVTAGLAGLALSTFLPNTLLLFVMAILVIGVGGVALWGYRSLDIYGGKGTARTTDSSALRGKTGRVIETVTPTDGHIKLDGGGFNPLYSARSVEGVIEEGEEVIVVDPGGGNVVTVEAIGGGIDEIDRALARGRREADASDRRARTGADAGGDTERSSADEQPDGTADMNRNVERDP